MRKIKFGLLALLIITPLFLLAVDQSYAFLGKWQTKVGNPPPPGEAPSDSGGGGITFPKCKTLQTGPASCLLKDFGIITRASYGYNPTGSDRIKLYNVIWQNAQSREWKRQLLRTGRMTLYLGDCTADSCENRVVGTRALRIDRYTSLNDAGRRYLITHEVGHLMRRGNPNIEKRYNPFAHSGKDKGCYDSRGFMWSYALSGTCGGSNVQSESYSEAMANYLTKNSYNRSGGSVYCSKSLDNYKTKCNSSYNWMKNNVYGGYEFY